MPTVVTGFDYLSRDDVLQQHWLRRFVAIVIDSLIIYVPLWIILGAINLPLLWPSGLYGVFLFLYSTAFDLAVGGTLGKMLMHMKTVAIHGKLTSAEALMRNVSKIFALFLLLDWIVGMAVDTNDPRQKWTDKLAGTSVMVYEHPRGT